MPREFAPSNKDKSQYLIEPAFIAAGWVVCDTHALGKFAPDLFVSKRFTTVAIECKTGTRKRKAHQVVWADKWQGHYLTGNDPQELLKRAEEILSWSESAAAWKTIHSL